MGLVIAGGVLYHRCMGSLPSRLVALASRIAPILQQCPEIAAVYLFGSVARGTETQESDIDLGLVLADRYPTDDYHRLIGDLAAQLEIAAAPRLVDLVVLGVQGPVFCHQVLLDGHLIYENDRNRRIDFESDTVIRALDFRPTMELARQGYLNGFRSWLRSYRDRERHRATA